MSTLPENELDLEKLFLPAWAQEPPSAKNYANYEGGGDRPDRKGDRPGGRRPPRRDGGSGFGGDRPRPNRPGGDRPAGQPGQPRRQDDRPRSFDKGRPAFRGQSERREPPPPLPEINTSFVPEEKGVESLARQIKMTGRAYPLFDIARLILDRPERHTVTFSVVKKADGQAVQPLFLCALDETLWLSENDAIAHVLKNHFATFYQAERTATEPPKGKYTFVAQCGLSGVILGPPNHHDYQNQLHKLHTQRFARMPFDVFKARVKIVRDEEVVKKWVEDQSWKTEYICLNMPEPLRLASREDVEKHFRETHKEVIIKPVASHKLTGVGARALRSPDLTRLVRQTWEDQKRFPLQIATVLSQQFAGHGLQFFKVNKAITHVSVARPHYLDLETTPVSETVRRIVDYINAKPRSTRRKVIEALAPTPAPPAAPTVIPVAPAPAAASNEPAPATIVPEAAMAATKTASPVADTEPTPEQTAINADLHWLVHQGHVIEFANGVLETAKKPLPRPPKPAKPETQKHAGQPADAAPAAESAASTEIVTVEQIAAAQSSDEVSSLPEPSVPTGTPAVETPAETKPEPPQGS